MFHAHAHAHAVAGSTTVAGSVTDELDNMSVINHSVLVRNGFPVVLLFIVLATLRFADIEIYPLLGPDEGLWNIEIKDAVLFGDRTMSGMSQMFAAPLHFAVGWCWLNLFPATVFSLRILSGVWGLLSLVIIYFVLSVRYNRKTALTGLAVIGFSFVMITINRRAYLESAMIFLCLAAFAFSLNQHPSRYICLGLTVAGILAYKAMVVYLLPCLLIPATNKWREEVPRRLVAVLMGATLGFLVIYSVSFFSPKDAAMLWSFEFSKGAGADALLRIGRFGIYPEVLMETCRMLITKMTDLVVLTIAGVGLFLVTKGWGDRFMLRLILWLLGGYAWIFFQCWQHAQYFAPLIVPAGLLTVAGVSRLNSKYLTYTVKLVMWLVVTFSFLRLGYGWNKAHSYNPPIEAVSWLKQQPTNGETFLAGPEVSIATENKGYPFNWIFHPPAGKAPQLVEFVRERKIRYIIFDEWESAPFFRDDELFHSQLNSFEKVAAGNGWVAYRAGDSNCLFP